MFRFDQPKPTAQENSPKPPERFDKPIIYPADLNRGVYHPERGAARERLQQLDSTFSTPKTAEANTSKRPDARLENLNTVLKTVDMLLKAKKGEIDRMKEHIQKTEARAEGERLELLEAKRQVAELGAVSSFFGKLGMKSDKRTLAEQRVTMLQARLDVKPEESPAARLTKLENEEIQLLQQRANLHIQIDG